ncbi:MAG: hypothetical protein HXS48_14925 [Theionarchaea archaeon]|nr:hypothetical protein [Theionarchaea archaeon]
MTIDILGSVSEYMKETNFFHDQKKLDAIYYLMQGLTYRQIAEKIGRQISYVQSVMDFLGENHLLHWGRWSPNVYKIGMKNSIAFLDWENREVPAKDNFKYTTYVYYVQAGEKKVFVVYTYPKEDESKIIGDTGELITPFYHTKTRITVPFFKKIDLAKEYFDIFGSVENDNEVLIGTPSFEAGKTYDDPITVYICRYAQLLPELTPGILTQRLEQDFKDHGIEINFDQVKAILNRMKKEGVIFARNPLHFEPLQYQASIVKISTKEIYRIMGTFSRFNMLTTLAFTRYPEIFYLYIQYPFYQLSDVMEILGRLDPTYKAYIATKFIMADTIYYQWSLERFLKSESTAR